MPELFTHGHALLIGIGDDLPVTAKDAAVLYNVLVDPTRAAYPPEQVELLTDQAATRQGILKGLDSLISRVNKDPEATALVYFSGHGGRVEHPNKPFEYYLVPYGYDPSQRLNTAVSGEEFTRNIESLEAQKLMVFLDCCHAGGVPTLKATGESFVKSHIPPELDALEMGSGRVVVTSSHEDEYSYTGDPYSVFTTVLLEALAGKGAAAADGYARILQVLIHLFDQVPKRAPGSQHPFIKKILDMDDNFPICYYAGGGKRVPAGIDLPAAAGPLPTTLSAWERQQFKREIQGLDNTLRLQTERLNLLREAEAVEMNPLIKYQHNHHITKVEAEITRLQERLRVLHSALE